ncbi:DEAD/DEAH box helicase [Candidatus Woesearchaeota archaeon]|nr:MAG: DEAD/DEAH box helicase [Candidatus Woesearchaeota archaeon]
MARRTTNEARPASTKRPLTQYYQKIPARVAELLRRRGFQELMPTQWKSIEAGLFDDENLLVCTPTASGKTLVAELAILNAVLHDKGKAVYVAPLRALASEKFKSFKKHYPSLKTAMTTGDVDSDDAYLARYDVIVTTSEKLDSLLRHKTPWLSRVKCVIIDEVHLLNDASRGPTLEVVITLLQTLLPHLHLVALSATIGNPEELAEWLGATLVRDSWRPTKLYQGVYLDGEITFL